VREDLADRTDPFPGTPGVLFGGHGLGQSSVALLKVGDFVEELSTRAG
jgi:hypothetical protein